MTTHPLDNPVWASLTGAHARFAVGGEHAKRYPGEIAPFVAVEHSGDPTAAEAAAALVAPGESCFFVSVAPALPASWHVETETIHQMVCPAPMAIPDSPVQVSRLGPRDNDDMVALTGLVYAGFFRPRTAELGDYVGIRVDGRLVSMAGERMHPHGWCELSGICTHLEHTGRGYARRLVAQLVQEIFARGETPFLHVEHTNVHASSLYERWGFEYRRDLELWRAVNGPPDPARTGHAHAHMRRA